MVYLFLGNNAALKQKKIDEIKSKHLTTKDALHFDYELLYGDKLAVDDLKKALLNLPAVAKKRVVVVKQIDKFKKDHQRIVGEFLTEKNPSAVLILDSDRSDLKNAFINKLKREANFTEASQGQTLNVFDMTNAMERRRHVDALKVLDQLMDEGNHPLQIMGVLIWFWGRMKQKVSKKRFQKGLEFLEEADLNIKRSRLKPEYAVEKCVVSLSALLA